MRRLWCGALVLLLIGPPAWADDKDKEKPKADQPKTATEQFQALIKEFSEERQKNIQAYRAATTDEEKKKLIDKINDAKAFTDKALKLAEKHPKEDVAIDALLFTVQLGRGSADAKKALEMLLKDHSDNPKLAMVCMQMANSGDESAESFLKKVREQSKNKDLQGAAAFGLATAYKNRADNASPNDAERFNSDAEKLFDEVATKYADVKVGRGTLGEAAKTELFELRNLAVGKTAPEIEGEDSDGKKFKLSDYRGKVVVIDFWARW